MSSNAKLAKQINDAVDMMVEKKAKWRREHPEEDYPNICPICKGSGLKKRVFDEWDHEILDESRWNEPGMYEYFEPCPCTQEDKKEVDERRQENNKRFAEVPSLYADAYLDNFRTDIYRKMDSVQKVTMAKKEVEGYIKNFDKMKKYGMGLYIFSTEKGSGKSRLASTITNELIKRDVRCKFASCSGILSDIQHTWGGDASQDEWKVLQKYIEPDVLIVDDLGARSGKDWMEEKLLMLIDARYRDMKITIFTSNYSIKGLPFRDNRIGDRISDVDRFHVVVMPPESVRKVTRGENQKDLFSELIKEDEGV